MKRPGVLRTSCMAALLTLLACGDGPSTSGTGTSDTPATTSGSTTTTGSSGTTAGTTDAIEATSTTAASTTGATGTTAPTTGSSCVDIDGECCPLEQACGNFDCCGDGMFCEVDLYCREKCQPLQPTCAPGDVCVVSVQEELFYCEMQAEPGAAGDPCACLNCCDLGLICLAGTAVQGCMSDSCCTPLCDLSNPIACPGDMESCKNLYTEGTAPAGYENVGLCSL